MIFVLLYKYSNVGYFKARFILNKIKSLSIKIALAKLVIFCFYYYILLCDSKN